MIKSTASAGPVELQSSSSAYYLWEFPEKPVSVRLSLDVVDKLERDVLESFRAITARGSEIGGLLLGRCESGAPLKTVIDDYELFHCEYTRGPLYLLSEEEKGRLDDLIRRKKPAPGGSVVGFFRSNTRKDLALDDEDLEMFQKYFSRPEQAFLLVKPFAAKPSTGGLFIWESGKVRGEGSYIEFPFRRSELGKGDFAKSLVIDSPRAKEAPAEIPAATTHKTGSRAPVLPFSLKREEETPVAAPPLKREERAPVVTLSPKTEEEIPEVLSPVARQPVEPEEVPVERKPAVETPFRKSAEKPVPALSAPREEKREEKKEEKKAEAPAAWTEPAKPSVWEERSERTERPAVAERPAIAERPEKREKAEVAEERQEWDRKAAATADVSVPKLASLSTPSMFGGKKIWALAGGLTMLSLAGGTMYYLKTHSSADSSAVVRDSARFQLKAERVNGQMIVTWNKDSNPVKTAQRAMLSITDGSQKEDIPLDLAQLREGKIEYRPVTGNVSFRLEVTDGNSARTRSESVLAPLPTATGDAPAAPSTTGTEKPAVGQPPASQLQPPPQKPAADAARLERQAETPAEPAQPQRPNPKAFSLAARIHTPEATDLPEAPRVDPSATSVGGVRPAMPSRLPAPPPPVQAPQPQAQTPPAQAVAPAVPPAVSNPPRVGGKVQEPKLVRRVDAVYPPMARQARVGGVVRMRATIGKDGKVKKLEVLSGPPLLKQAATDAVQRWIYNPSLLNGTPVESTTDIDLTFNLNGR